MFRRMTSCACAGRAMMHANGASGGAMAYQLGTLKNTAEYGGIEFGNILAEPEGDYALKSPFIAIREPGTYLVQYAVFIPAACSVDTVFCLQLSDRTLLSSTVHATKGESEQGATYFGQALIALSRPTDLCLSSRERLQIADTCATAMATMSILRLR